jgi:hypothetical protein
MRFTFKGKIAKDGRYLTTSDDIRLDKNGLGKWQLVGFAHNPDGYDRKDSTMIQHGDHYGQKNGNVTRVTLIDTPEFFGVESWDTLDEARLALNEGVPLNTKWGFDAESFGKHARITFNSRYGECVIYDLDLQSFSW